MPIQTAIDSISNSQGSPFGFKNRIINGGMVIDQRNAGASVTPTSTGYTIDRWQATVSQSSKLSVQQNAGSVTPPTGFTNYLGVTSLSSYSITSSDFFDVRQSIEGFNVADLNWGSSDAQTITLSFWVRSSLTGTFGGALKNSAGNRSYPFTYTINSANTWEKETITIPGDTTGTWLTTNGAGLIVQFGLGVGSTYTGTAGAWAAENDLSVTGAVSVVGTNGATFYITGVQLEKGTQATAFDYRPFGYELSLCQRYYQKSYNYTKAPGSTTTHNEFEAAQFDWGSSAVGIAGGTLTFPVVMRATPTLTIYDHAGNSGRFTGLSDGASQTNNVAPNVASASTTKVMVRTYANSYNGMEWNYVVTAEL